MGNDEAGLRDVAIPRSLLILDVLHVALPRPSCINILARRGERALANCGLGLLIVDVTTVATSNSK
jgi:hypothetical protein